MGIIFLSVLFILTALFVNVLIRAKRLKQDNDRIFHREWRKVYYGSKINGDEVSGW